MSSSTSSFNLPEERLEHALHAAQFEREQRWTLWLCRLSPLLFLLLLPIGSYLLLPILFLQPIDWEAVSIRSLFDSKSLLLATSVSALPWIWRWTLLLESRVRSSNWPVALLLSLLLIVVANIGLTQPRIRWFFVEWAKIRTPNPSFARNTLFWEQREFGSKSLAKFPTKRIALVGSSQMFQSTDLDLLAQSNDRWEKQCLAGFGPMQYPWLIERILERQPNVVVCWLSEFDFYREDAVPTSRLQWAATNQRCLQLFGTLSPTQRWQNRGEFADLSLAANIPVWRHREHLRRTLLNYWWNVSRPPAGVDDNAIILAESANLQASIENLRTNVRRTTFVEVNFRSFAQFATELRQHNIELIVFEGQLHPDTVVAFDAAYHREVNDRIAQLAHQHDFRYVANHELLRLTADDFADGYHTNLSGRSKWSTYLSTTVTSHTTEH